MNDKRLSKLQRYMITQLGNIIVNSFGDDEDQVRDVRYRALFNQCSGWWFKGVPAIENERRFKTAQSAFSRAVWSMVERGLITGVALAWCDIKTMDAITWHGGGPSRRVNGYAESPRPQIKMLSLSRDGWIVYRATAQHDTTATNGGERDE